VHRAGIVSVMTEDVPDSMLAGRLNVRIVAALGPGVTGWRPDQRVLLQAGERRDGAGHPIRLVLTP